MSEPNEIFQSPVWRVTEVKYPGVIWNRYANAITLPVLHETYGSHWPPPETRPGEKVYAVRDPAKYQRPFDPTDHPAAWISLTQDQFDPRNYYMSRGVWPEQHGQGLGLFMRQWAEEQVARDGGNSLTIWVHFSNKTHWNNVITDPYWTVAGSAIDPAAMMFVHEIDNAQT